MLKFVFNLLFAVLTANSFAEKPSVPFSIENTEVRNIHSPKLGLITLLEYNNTHPPKIKFSDAFPLQNCRLDGKSFSCKQGIALALNDHNHAKKIFHLAFQLEGEAKEIEYKIQLLPDDFPEYDFVGTSKVNKNFIFALADEKITDAGHLLILNPAGGIQFYRHLDVQAHDFKPHTLNDQRIVYSYSPVESLTLTNSTGHRHILDQDFKEIKIIKQSTDMHEFQMTSINHYLGSFYEKMINPLGKCIINQGIREYSDDQLIFQLSLTDLMGSGIIQPSPKTIFFESEPCYQFFHLNSVQTIEKNHLLISLGSRVALMYDQSLKKIDWVLGGFSDQFGIQNTAMTTSLIHSPKWDSTNSTLTLFDNGLEISSSRILQYQLDPKNFKLKKFDILFDNGTFANIMGSVEIDKVRGDSVISIGWGHKRSNEYNFEEVLNKKSHLTIKFKNSALSSYKVYRF